MKNAVISVRIPNSMVGELKEISKRDHFLDVSEVVRDIIRSNWLNHIQKQQQQQKETIKEKTERLLQMNQEQLLKELIKLQKEKAETNKSKKELADEQ